MSLINYFDDSRYNTVKTIFNLEETIIFTKNNFRWGWIQKKEKNYVYGYIERYNSQKISEKELFEEISIGMSRYVTLFTKDIISNEYIEKILKIPNRVDILSKYKIIKYIKSNKIKRIKKFLESNENEILTVKSKNNDIIIFRTFESDWQVISFNKDLKKLMLGFLDIDMDILFYKVLTENDDV